MSLHPRCAVIPLVTTRQRPVSFTVATIVAVHQSRHPHRTQYPESPLWKQTNSPLVNGFPAVGTPNAPRRRAGRSESMVPGRLVVAGSCEFRSGRPAGQDVEHPLSSAGIRGEGAEGLLRADGEVHPFTGQIDGADVGLMDPLGSGAVLARRQVAVRRCVLMVSRTR